MPSPPLEVECPPAEHKEKEKVKEGKKKKGRNKEKKRKKKEEKKIVINENGFFLLPIPNSFELDDAIESSRLDRPNQMIWNLNRNT